LGDAEGNGGGGDTAEPVRTDGLVADGEGVLSRLGHATTVPRCRPEKAYRKVTSARLLYNLTSFWKGT
jgi:hypothetical protein